MIGLTTGRETSQRLNSLLRELVHTIPAARLVRRGKSSLEDLTARLLREDLNYAIIFHRRHGGPGGVDFFEVQATGLNQIPPSIELSAMKLRREYSTRRSMPARAITFNPDASEQTRHLSNTFGRVLGLPELVVPTRSEVECSIHIIETTGGKIEVVGTSPPGLREVGPKLVVSRLEWDIETDKVS